MLNSERIQAVIHKLEVESSSRWLNYLALALLVVALAVWYDTHCYQNFKSPEAMDAAQVARNLSEGRGFSTDFVQPFGAYLLQKHNQGASVKIDGTNVLDAARVDGPYPDLANAPLYPLLLAGMMKMDHQDWALKYNKPFWSSGGHFVRYKPEFAIAVVNQILFVAAICLTFLIAKAVLDAPAAWLSAVLMFGSDQMWKFSVSGLPVLLMMVIFLGIVWCLVSFENLGKAEQPDERRRFIFAMVAGFLTGLGMLTRYSFGWAIIPVVLYFVLFGGARRSGLALTTALVFGLTVLPWIVRNEAVSGTLFGTAGYAVMQDTSMFPGSTLEQSLAPNLERAHDVLPYVSKFQANVRSLLLEDIRRIGGAWMNVLFFAGLLLGLRNNTARRLRYFTMASIGVFLVVSAMGRTEWTTLSPDMNSENLLVVLAPLIIIFGVAFFLTLLEQMNTPSFEVRYAVVFLVAVIACLQFILTLLPPRISPSAYPPYYPPEIQGMTKWVGTNDLVMSDIPWAVAWYADRQSVWTTVDCRSALDLWDKSVRPVNALYLSPESLDAKLFSECVHGDDDSWSKLAFNAFAFSQLPTGFPLTFSAPTALNSGILLLDRKRW